MFFIGMIIGGPPRCLPAFNPSPSSSQSFRQSAARNAPRRTPRHRAFCRHPGNRRGIASIPVFESRVCTTALSGSSSRQRSLRQSENALQAGMLRRSEGGRPHGCHRRCSGGKRSIGRIPIQDSWFPPGQAGMTLKSCDRVLALRCSVSSSRNAG